MAKEKESVGGQLLDLVGKASAEDLAEIDAAIVAKEKELDDLCAEKEKEIKSLGTLRRVLATALGVLPPRKQAARKAAVPAARVAPSANGAGTGGPDERRQAIAIRLMRQGPAMVGVLSREFNVTPVTIYATLDNHPWFEKNDSKYELTPQGRAAVKDLLLKTA